MEIELKEVSKRLGNQKREGKVQVIRIEETNEIVRQ